MSFLFCIVNNKTIAIRAKIRNKPFIKLFKAWNGMLCHL